MFTTVFHDLLSKNLANCGDKVAVIDRDCGYTYEQINEKVETLASWMYERGVRRGDRVGIYLSKSIEEVVAMFSVARIGAVFVNINYQWTIDQFDYVVNDCEISLAIVDEKRARELAQKTIPVFMHTILVKGKAPDSKKFFDWDGLVKGRLSVALESIDADLAAILYTSGSTGRPKGVMLTHLNLIQGARSVGKYLQNNAKDRLISLLPFSFDYGLSQLTTMFLVGGSIVLQPITMPSEIIKSIVSNKATGLAAVPPTWVSVVRYLIEVPTAFPALRYITNSGGKIPIHVLQSMKEVFPEVDIYLMYGLTESFRSTYLSPEHFEEKLGSMGKSIPNADTFIINDGKVCGPGEEGELIHRGTLVSKGYWGKKEETDEKIKECPAIKSLIGDEKVVYSGDIVRIDDDGFYWFVSRRDSLIKSTGFRISPQEVEEIVQKYENVAAAVAFGQEDEMLGQAVHVIVSTVNNELIDKSGLLKHCRQNMPHYMIPKAVHQYLGSMPKTGSGKIDVPAVIKQFKS